MNYNIEIVMSIILFKPESTEGVAVGATTAMEQDIVVNREEEYKM